MCKTKNSHVPYYPIGFMLVMGKHNVLTYLVQVGMCVCVRLCASSLYRTILFAKNVQGEQKENYMNGTCSTHGMDEKCIQNFSHKT